MKAMVYHEYGSPDTLELQEIEMPLVNDDGVLVRVHAASLNWLDWHFLTDTLPGAHDYRAAQTKKRSVGH